MAHCGNYGSVCTHTHHGYGFGGYGYGVRKLYLQYTHEKPQLQNGYQKYLRGVRTLEGACGSVQTLLYEDYHILFPSRHTGCSVSALKTQMFYPVYKVPQLHLLCSYSNHTISINGNHIGRLMHVAHSATGSILQIFESHMHHQS